MTALRKASVVLIIALGSLGFASPFAAPVSAQPSASISRDFLFGRWTDTGNCSDAVDFFADGTFATTAGARGRWDLSGDRIRFIGNSTVSARLRVTGRDSISLTHDDGTVGSSTRCSAQSARRITMPPLPATIAQAISMSRPLTRAQLIGRWTDDGDCGNGIQFLQDGRFITNGASGRWTLVGEQLSFIGERTVAARARLVGSNRILLVHPDRSMGQSMRC